MSSSFPHELEEWLPSEVSPASVIAWARIARSFDRVTGEALALRLSDGTPLLLTRPETFEVFRALPLAASAPMRVTRDGADLRLAVRVVDGRALSLPLREEELAALREVLGASADVPRAPAAPAEAPSPARRPSTVRPPESAEFEVVRIPRSMRSALAPRTKSDPPGRAPSSSPPPRGSISSSPPPRESISSSPPRAAAGAKSDSVRPPAFAPEPAPIVRTARDTDALRASFRHHFDHGALDEAGQVARALAHLGIADAMERRLAQLQPEAPPGFATPLSPYLFRAFLAHDEEDVDLGRVLAAIWPAYLQMRARPDRELGLRPRDEVPLASAPEGLPRLFAHGARAFSLDAPRLFLRTDVPGGMAHLHAMPIASLCGGTLATAFDGPSTLHVLGHHLSLYRHEAYLIALAPAPQELHAITMAALHLEGRAPAEDARVAGLAETLARHMVPPVREALRQACGDLVLLGGDPRAAATDALRRHRRAVMLTAVRAGFALSGSLAISDRMQRVMPAVPGLTVDEMLDDLITYSVSSSWSALRKELGIALEPSGPNPPIGERA